MATAPGPISNDVATLQAALLAEQAARRRGGHRPAQADDRQAAAHYTYDFGDSWEHRITITTTRPGLPGVSYPHYAGGEWDCPPEDCGGIPGYCNMLDALADPEHPDHAEVAEVAEYLEDWDPKEIDELPLRIALGRIANRRNAARTRIAKKRP